MYMSRAYVVLTLGLAGSTIAATQVVHAAGLELGFVMSIIGSTASVALQFGFPAAMLHKLGKPYQGHFMALFSAFVCVAGLFVTLAGAACKGASPRSSGFCTSAGFTS